MAIAIALIVIVLGSVIFHFWSPWTQTPIASNWGTIDDTMAITLIITGVVFILINFFVAYAVWKFRHSKTRKAHYEPENKRLEWWLTGLTSLGIIAMLAPGLYVYADFVQVPEDAMEVEVVGQQWSWGFRFAGNDGKLGKSDISHISLDNSFGLDPNDATGLDDRLVHASELVLPLGKPVKLLLRSKDVLHDFYVPNFRVKMDMVPGSVSYIWFTPTRPGTFDILCAEFCGNGHFNMRGKVTVVPPQDFETWLASQETFGDGVSKARSEPLSLLAQQGQVLAGSKGCVACHNFTADGVGPSWQGLYGSERKLSDGRLVRVDDAYLIRAMAEPNVELVEGFAALMPPVPLSEDEMIALIAFIKERGARPGSPVSEGEIIKDRATNETQSPKVKDATTALKGALDGGRIAMEKGCLACHSIDGQARVGPSWQDIFGTERELATGTKVRVDEAYLMEAIYQPNARIVKGYPAIMPPGNLSPPEAQAIIDYIKTL